MWVECGPDKGYFCRHPNQRKVKFAFTNFGVLYGLQSVCLWPEKVEKLNNFFENYRSGDEYDRNSITHVILLPWQSRVYLEPLKLVEFVQLTTECCWGQPSDPCQRGCLTSHACVMWGPRTLNADDDDDDDVPEQHPPRSLLSINSRTLKNLELRSIMDWRYCRKFLVFKIFRC